jgi:tripartite-type tricarboxylate transporter receptor subunit TctC
MIGQLFSALFVVFVALSWNSMGTAQTPYYAGKTINIVVGTKAGDVYDLYARHFAQFMPKYILGNPNIIVQNMAGAGSMIAANFVYNVANPDGLTIGAIFPALYFDQVVQRKEVRYDWSKFVWIGSPVTSNHLLYMRADSPFKTIHDVIKASPAPKCGATGTSSTAYYVPKLLDETIGTNFDVARVSSRTRHRSGGGEKRSRVPRLYRDGIFCPRTLHHLAQEQVRQRAGANRQQTGQAAEGHADDL